MNDIYCFKKLAQSRRGNPEHEAEKKKEQDKWDEMTTMYLGKPAKELKPWYSNADLISGEDRKRTEDQWQELKYVVYYIISIITYS